MSENQTYLDLISGVYEVRGPAGAGKTYRLTQDVQELVKTGKKCTLISFSNAAVDELKLRIGIDSVVASTIHSFAWHLISPLSTVLLDEADLLTEFEPDAFKKSKDGLSWDGVSQLLYDTGVPYYNEEDQILSLGHNDVIKLFDYLLDCLPIFAQLVINSMDVLIIDEYQDTNRTFLKHVMEKLDAKILIGLYGDPCQTIYRVDKGAPDLDALLTAYQTTKVPLTSNYRSDSNLVEYFNQVRASFDGLAQMATAEHAGGEIHVIIGDGELNDDIRQKIIQKYALSHAMTLSSTNYLALAAVGQGDIAKSAHQKVNKYRQANHHGGKQWGDFLSLEPLIPELSVLNTMGQFFSGKGYRQTQAALECFTLQSIERVGLSQLDDLITTAAEQSFDNFEDFFKSHGLIWQDSIQALLELVKTFGADGTKKVSSFLEALEKLTDSTTIFQAKGREYQSVILNIDTGQYWPYGWKNIDFDNSESNGVITSAMVYFLYYVGITRAKSKLVIYINRKTDQEFLGKFEEQFHFDELEVADL